MSERNDFRYNASGYRDDTAYQAIGNIMRESYTRKKKHRSKSGDKAGDLLRHQHDRPLIVEDKKKGK